MAYLSAVAALTRVALAQLFTLYMVVTWISNLESLAVSSERLFLVALPNLQDPRTPLP